MYWAIHCFSNAMKHYVAKWKFAHPYFEDFRQSIIEYTHQDLNWYFRPVARNDQDSLIMESNPLKKHLKNNEYKIKFKRYGETCKSPIDFTVNGEE
jgi:hypothetical protein